MNKDQINYWSTHFKNFLDKTTHLILGNYPAIMSVFIMNFHIDRLLESNQSWTNFLNWDDHGLSRTFQVRSSFVRFKDRDFSFIEGIWSQRVGWFLLLFLQVLSANCVKCRKEKCILDRKLGSYPFRYELLSGEQKAPLMGKQVLCYGHRYRTLQSCIKLVFGMRLNDKCIFNRREELHTCFQSYVLVNLLKSVTDDNQLIWQVSYWCYTALLRIKTERLSKC